MATCYRHPKVETGVSCSNCGRPICTDCMTVTPVGMRCPECARQRTRVHTMRSLNSGDYVTRALIAINVLAFLASGSFTISNGAGSAQIVNKGVLYGPSIEPGHEYWRLVTSGFLHANLLHIFFNMYLLFMLGQMLEPAIGRIRFGAIYFVALLAGSLGALIATPYSPTLGASGAVFGLMGAAVVEMRSRGIDPMQSGIPMLIVLNLVISFTLPGISIGAHVGGLIGGSLAAAALNFADRRRSLALGLAACVLLAAGAVGGSIAAARSAEVAPMTSGP